MNPTRQTKEDRRARKKKGVNGKCKWPGCKAKAAQFAAEGQYSGEPDIYCSPHAQVVADAHNPEYTAVCPNCSCMFGVN